MQEFGNVLTIGGILVTLVAYFGQHSGVTLVDLEPGLVKRWRASRSWVRRKLGRDVGVVVQVAPGRISVSGGQVVVWSWQSIEPDDDLAVRVDKLSHNQEQLRKNLGELRELDNAHHRKRIDGLATRLADLKRVVNERHEQTRRESTAAMRWEVRGLLITLVGAGISVIG